MKDNSVCIKCGGTGIDALGNPCSCGINKKIEMPVCLKVPMQYQGLKFNKAFIRKGLPPLYGETLDKILQECIDSFGQFKRNILICAPPGSSKTIWAYTLYSMLFSMGCEIPEIMDLMQCREILLNYYTEDKEALRLLSTAPLAVIKIPWDLPNRFVETVSTIIDRRVRANCSTIFLYNGSKTDLKARDSFGKLSMLEGDGYFNSLKIYSWEMKNDVKQI